MPSIGPRILAKLRSLYEVGVHWFLRPVLAAEWRRPPFTEANERSVEYAFALSWIAKVAPKSLLDVGCGKTAWPHLVANCGIRVTAIDEIRGYWRKAYVNRHYHVVDDDITRSRLDRTFECVTCISVLEHIPDADRAIREMTRLVAPGGHLVLTCPYSEGRFIENVYALPDAGYGKNEPYICRVYSRAQIDRWFAPGSWEILEQAYYRVFEGPLWTMGPRTIPAGRVSKDDLHQLTCLIARRRVLLAAQVGGPAGAPLAK